MQTLFRKGHGTRDTLPPPFPGSRMTDRRLSKHYLPITTVTDSNKNYLYEAMAPPYPVHPLLRLLGRAPMYLENLHPSLKFKIARRRGRLPWGGAPTYNFAKILLHKKNCRKLRKLGVVGRGGATHRGTPLDPPLFKACCSVIDFLTLLSDSHLSQWRIAQVHKKNFLRIRNQTRAKWHSWHK